jgi:Zn finger protein HypA/HybF involved in hydrogenase expression
MSTKTVTCKDCGGINWYTATQCQHCGSHNLTVAFHTVCELLGINYKKGGD